MLGHIDIYTLEKIHLPVKPRIIGNNSLLNTTGRPYKFRTFYSDSLGQNISGVIFGNDGYVGFNAQPFSPKGDYNIVTKKLQKIHKELAEQGNEIWGFICGGLSDCGDKLSKSSYTMYNQIAEAFDKFGFPFGMICGKKNPDGVENLRITQNRAFVWGDYLHDNIKGDYTRQELIDRLSELYNDVEVPDNIDLNLSPRVR